MKEPKFKYNNKVRITESFYKGSKAIIKDYSNSGFLRKKYWYLVKGKDFSFYIEEEHLELIK